MGRQEDLINQIESGPKPGESTIQPQQQPQAYTQPNQSYQEYPETPAYTPPSKPVVKRGFFDILMLISYVLLGIVATAIAILLIYANFR